MKTFEDNDEVDGGGRAGEAAKGEGRWQWLLKSICEVCGARPFINKAHNKSAKLCRGTGRGGEEEAG